MKVEFIRDVFNAGTKIYQAGTQYEGDLARYVRRGDAVEVKGKSAGEAQAVDKAPGSKAGKGKGKGK